MYGLTSCYKYVSALYTTASCFFVLFFYQYSPIPCLLYSLTTPILRIYAKVASSPNLKERMPASYKQMRKAQKNDYRQEKQINLWLCQLLWCRQINTIQSKIIISFKSTDTISVHKPTTQCPEPMLIYHVSYFKIPTWILALSGFDQEGLYGGNLRWPTNMTIIIGMPYFLESLWYDSKSDYLSLILYMKLIS